MTGPQRDTDDTGGWKVQSAVRVARVAGFGAAAWLAYGVAESLLVLSAPVLRRVGAAVRPEWFVDRGGSIGSLAVALPATVIYLALGLLAGFGLAVALRSPWLSRLLPSDRASRTYWLDLATVSVVFAYGTHAWHVHEWPAVAASVVAGALVGWDLWVAWRRNSTRHWSSATHPVLVIVGLLVASFVGQIGPNKKFPDGAIAAALTMVLVALLAAAVASSTRSIRRRLGGRRVAGLSAAAAALVAIAWLGPSSARLAGSVHPSEPDVILITLDTVRADHLSSYGYSRETTPNLDRLAATVYDRAVASSNWTLPSHASILTGLSPRRHGAHDRKGTPIYASAISPSTVTAAQLLKKRGYHTAAVVANVAVLLPEFGINRGFDVYDLVPPDFVPGPQDPRYLLSSAIRNLIVTTFGEKAQLANADKVNRRAIRELRASAGRKQPFFLWLNYMDAHAPYVPPSPFDTRYPGKSASFDWSAFPHLVEEVSMRHQRPLTDAETAHLVSQYDGALSYLDDRLARLFDTLRELNLYDNSLIIITSDHGEALGESMMISHGLSLYQPQVGVPLLVKYPGAQARSHVSTPVSSVDLLPTILDVVGAPELRGAEGESLRTLPNGSTRWVTSESYRPRGKGFASLDEGPDEMALFAGPWKLIVGGGGARELYDLASDPGEHHDLSGRLPISAAWMSNIRAAMDEARHTSHAPAVPIDEDAVERLRSLGYVR